MTSLVVNIAKLLLLLLVVGCAILSFYAAVNAINIHSGHNVFLSGIVAIGLAALLNPIFCFVAAWGMIRYLDVPAWIAISIVLPVGFAWCVAAARVAARKAGFDLSFGARQVLTKH